MFNSNKFFVSAFLESLMLQIDSLQFHNIPDYNLFRSIFQPHLCAMSHSSATSVSSSTSTSISSSMLISNTMSSEDDEVILSLKMVRTPTCETSPEAGSSSSKRKRPKRSPLLAKKRKGLRRRTGKPWTNMYYGDLKLGSVWISNGAKLDSLQVAFENRK